VIETETVPKTFVGAGGMRFVAPGDEQEPIGNRIIVLPQEETRAKSRDPHSGFVDYVPSGSTARAESLVTTGDGGKTIPCGICPARRCRVSARCRRSQAGRPLISCASSTT